VHGAATSTLLVPGRLLVTSLLALGRADEALAIAEDDLALARRLGADHVEVARALQALGGARAARGDLAQARDELGHAVAGLRAVLGPSPEGAAALAALGDVLARAGDRDGAIARATEAVDMARAGGVAASDTARLVRSLALLVADRDPGRAEGLLRTALAEQLTALGPQHPEVAATRRALDDVLAALGRAEP
jgi:tetratricopeptide (TPR) repeat protein